MQMLKWQLMKNKIATLHFNNFIHKKESISFLLIDSFILDTTVNNSENKNYNC